MDGRRVAVIVGVDQCGLDLALPDLRYAERDAATVHAVLTHPVTGTFDPADAFLLLGADANSGIIQGTLHAIAKESSPADVLLVYFAGHVLPAEWNGGDDYLVTPDLRPASLRQRPDEGLRMAFLRSDVFHKFKGESFLILDSCRAGSYVDGGAGEIELAPVGGRQSRQHSALMAAPQEGAARESEEFGHGVMTKYVLDALRGRAQDSEGRVTFGRMADYVIEQDIEPKPGQEVQRWGKSTVLTRPGLGSSGQGASMSDPLPADLEIVELESPLKRSAGAISQLLDGLFPRQPLFGAKAAAGHDKIQLICAATGAAAAALLEYTKSGCQPVSATAHFHQDDLHNLLHRTGHTASAHVVYGDAASPVLFVPVKHSRASSLVLVLVRPKRALLDIGEPLAMILETVWAVDLGGRPEEAEILVLTALRKRFGRLPGALYQRSFDLYRGLLDSFTMVFQPIVAIAKISRNIQVHGYEALARRNADDPKAPVELLRLAHDWSDQFVIARDEAILRKAIESYNLAHEHCHGDNAGAPLPLSINVGVRSLLSDSYLDVVERTIEAAGFDPGAVTLEISEHDPIEPRVDEDWGGEALEYFHRLLVDITRRLSINFAMDDFGVGHSSLSRMCGLPLTQIKVDRAVLLQPQADEALALVASVARHYVNRGLTASPRKVIVEGVEPTSPVGLDAMFKIGIRHVQGYVTGEPAPTIKREVAPETRERIAALVRGEHDGGHDATSRGSRAGSGDSLRRSA